MITTEDPVGDNLEQLRLLPNAANAATAEEAGIVTTSAMPRTKLSDSGPLATRTTSTGYAGSSNTEPRPKSSPNNFGPLARAGVGSSSKSVITTSLFQNSWKAEATIDKGEKAEAEYTMLHPRGGKAYFHLLLDASGSTWEKVKTGDKKRVYRYLLKNFQQLVEGGDTFLLPDDMIYVWSFNRKTTLLCRVEKKNFHAQFETIRAAYKKDFEDNYHNKITLKVQNDDRLRIFLLVLYAHCLCIYVKPVKALVESTYAEDVS